MKSTEKSYPHIRLNRNHIPLHPSLRLYKQEDYETHLSLFRYLLNQLDLGFDPKYMITLHLCHPSELSWEKRETNNPLGFRDRISFESIKPLWDEVGSYNYWDKHRNEFLTVEEDTRHLRNLLLKFLYGVKRLNRDHQFNVLIFMERGKAKVQYHLHILIPEAPGKSKQDIMKVLMEQIKPRVKCLSRWKKPEITDIIDKYNMFGYVNKETRLNNPTFSSYSLPITDKT